MSRGYKPTGPWRLDHEFRPVYGIRVECTDVIEVRCGRIWHHGAYRVLDTYATKAIVKTFIGEMAWADAQRLAEDLATERRFARLDRISARVLDSLSTAPVEAAQLSLFSA